MELGSEDQDSRFAPADYRVRLFLSVDLSGSTAFKNSMSGEERGEGPTPKWVTIFQQFYSGFPAQYRTEYQNHASQAVGGNKCPNLWKAVGDELVFCGRVTNTKAVIAALVAFIDTLQSYRKSLQDEGIDLNLKGAGWLAAFPEPNRAVQLRPVEGGESFISASEALEGAAGKSPYDYDFLGKAIDTGFRVAGSAKPERFVLSVQLARLLSSAPAGSGFDYEMRFDGAEPLKGVNGGEPYPIIYLDTMAHMKNESVRKKERSLLRRGEAPSKEDLSKYLDLYCGVVGTDDITLPTTALTAAPAFPESYQSHRPLIAEHLAQEKGREFDGGLTNEPDTDGDSETIESEGGLRPLDGDG